MSAAQIVRFLELAKPLTLSVGRRTPAAALAGAEQEFRAFCAGLGLAQARYHDDARSVR